MPILLIPLMFLAGLLLAAVFAFPSAWIVMLLLGVAHHMDPSIPAIGFWLTWVLVFALRVAVVSTSNKGD